jgi:2-C-methyl-D-erythritol 2,4-cyclodiphosphate synthase
MRIGQGYDSHRFDEGRVCILGGVTIPDAPGLSGFSDGDAVAHAVTDAVLGAAALGDIGRHFPPGDERWRDADSIDLLRRAATLVRDAGWRVGNVDLTVVTERMRIAPHAREMAGRLAAALGVGADHVSVKGKTNEGMGWEGAGDGLAVHAVALLVEDDGPRG